MAMVSAACRTVVPFFATTGWPSMRSATSSGPQGGSAGCGAAGVTGSGMVSASLQRRGAERAGLPRHVVVELGTELGDVRRDRPGDRLAERADGVPLDAARHVDQQVGILRPSLSRLETAQDLDEPAG